MAKWTALTIVHYRVVGEWRDVAAASTSQDQMLQIMPAMRLAMGPNASITPDGKSLFVSGGGWTWTFTPMAVR